MGVQWDLTLSVQIPPTTDDMEHLCVLIGRPCMFWDVSSSVFLIMGACLCYYCGNSPACLPYQGLFKFVSALCVPIQTHVGRSLPYASCMFDFDSMIMYVNHFELSSVKQGSVLLCGHVDVRLVHHFL